MQLLGYPNISPSTLETGLSPTKWTAGKAYDVSKLVEMHFMFILQDRIRVGSHQARRTYCSSVFVACLALL